MLLSIKTSNRDRRLQASQMHLSDNLLQSWALSNKLRIWSAVRVGHLLVLCEVSFRSPPRAECSKCEKLWQLSIDLIAKVTYWTCFLPNACEERHNANYRVAVDLRLAYMYLSRQFLGCISLSMRKAKDSIHNKLQRSTLRKAAVMCNPFSNFGEFCSTSLMLIFSDESFYIVELTWLWKLLHLRLIKCGI